MISEGAYFLPMNDLDHVNPVGFHVLEKKRISLT